MMKTTNPVRSAESKPRRSQVQSSAKEGHARSSNGFVEVGLDYARANVMQRIELIRHGVDAAVFVKAFKHYDMPRAQMAKIIGLSDATAGRKIKGNAKLGPLESERLIRIAMIEAEAEHVFGSHDAAKHWMLSSNLALGESPLSLLDTDAGAGEVRKVLNSIAYGGVA